MLGTGGGGAAIKTNLVRYFSAYGRCRGEVVASAHTVQDERLSNDRMSTMNAPLKSAVALCLLCIAGAQAEAFAPAQPPERRAVTVSGQGEVSAAPDRARLGMAVEETSTDLKAAQARSIPWCAAI